MFACESDLVEKLVADLQNEYGIQYIVRELRSGNNIADVVYTNNLVRENIVFDEYPNAYYYFNSIYKHKRVHFDEIEISDVRLNKKFNKFLSNLEDQGYIRIKDNYINIIKKVDMVSKKFTAIEAKLFDWKAGLDQASRYKSFANEVYIALDGDYIDRVDMDLLKKQGIGLMSVSHKSLKIVLKAKKENVQNIDIQYYIMDRFLKQLGDNGAFAAEFP